MLNQFSRTQLLLGEDAMKKLADMRVAVFGIGGVGGYVCEALVRSGIGHFDLIDDDKVCLTNINRQIIATIKTIGKYKVDVMKERMLDINPEVEVTVHKCFFLPENADEFPFAEYDYVVDAVDTVTAKIELVLPELKEIDFKGEKRDISFMVFSIFVSNNLVDFVNMESLCYLSRMKNFVDGITSNYDEKKNVLVVKGLKEKGSYFVNLQMKNMETGEIFVFQPIQITMNYKGLNIWVLILIGIVFAIILAVAVFFFMKYRKTKEVLKFQINDVRGDGPTRTMPSPRSAI